jgi:hypothetical protein
MPCLPWRPHAGLPHQLLPATLPSCTTHAQPHHACLPWQLTACSNDAAAAAAAAAAPQAFLLRKLKIAGSMGMAMKLPAVLEAAQPKAKL